MKILIAISIFFGVFARINGQSACVTPNGERAQCISIYKCQTFVDALAHRTSEIIKFVRDSRCGYMEDPLVCCGSVAAYQQVNTPRPPPTTPSTNTDSSNGNIKNHRNINLLPTQKKCGVQLPQDRVFGGNVTGIDEFPWMAILEYRRNGVSVGHNCGGVLINNRYVLTAAHCIVGDITTKVGNLFRVRLGEYNKDTDRDCVIREGQEDCADPHQDIDVEEAIAHPDYGDKSRDRYHDIGLIRLSRSVTQNDFVKPICLPLNGEKSTPGVNLTVAGWGYTEKNIFSPVKLKVNVKSVSNQQCNTVFKKFSVNLANTQLCAGGEAGKDSCQGDSGGPLMRTFPQRDEFYVEGIVSFGYLCGTDGVPGVYTRVSEYMKWILDNMKPF